MIYISKKEKIIEIPVVVKPSDIYAVGRKGVDKVLQDCNYRITDFRPPLHDECYICADIPASIAVRGPGDLRLVGTFPSGPRFIVVPEPDTPWWE